MSESFPARFFGRCGAGGPGGCNAAIRPEELIVGIDKATYHQECVPVEVEQAREAEEARS